MRSLLTIFAATLIVTACVAQACVLTAFTPPAVAFHAVSGTRSERSAIERSNNAADSVLSAAVRKSGAAGTVKFSLAAAIQKDFFTSSAATFPWTTFDELSDGFSPRSALVILTYGDKAYEYTDEYPDPPDFTVSEEYDERGLRLSPEKRMKKVDALISAGTSVKDALLYCFPLLSRTVSRALSEVRLSATDAKIKFDPDSSPMFEISRSRPGYELDETRVYSDVYFALKTGVTEVALSPVPVLPSCTASELAECTRLRSRFTTSISSSTAARKHNVSLALSRVSGSVIGAGETFSFNSVVGRRTEANGFEKAKIISGGEYTDGVGGGVCQASTTIYNAALLAGMDIVAVSRHSLVPTYVDPSFDAMVNGSGSDLKFRNGGDDPVFIRAYATSEKATVEFYSSELPYKVTLRSRTLKTGARPADKEFVDVERKYTAGMESGEKMRISGGAPSVSSEGYLIKTYPDGRKEEKRIRRDEYAAAAGKIAVAP